MNHVQPLVGRQTAISSKTHKTIVNWFRKKRGLPGSFTIRYEKSRLTGSVGHRVDCEFRFPDAMFLVELDLEEHEFEKPEIANDFASYFRWDGTGGYVPEALASCHVGDEEHFILWDETNVQLSEQTEQKDFANDSIEWLLKRCLDTEIHSIIQVRELLVE